MDTITYRTELKPGDIIICRVTSGMEYTLTEGKEYVCLEGLEPGIFHDRPYVSVLGDRNHKVSGHASRFVKKEP